jgi:hypothetical protein
MPSPGSRRGRPSVDHATRPKPTLSIAGGAVRYGIGRDQLDAAVKAGEVPSVRLNGRDRIVTSKADKMFGLD